MSDRDIANAVAWLIVIFFIMGIGFLVGFGFKLAALILG